MTSKAGNASNTPSDSLSHTLAFSQERHTEYRCECKLDGMAGNACELPVEQTCINQCSGRGACYLGFCKCFDGWYGHACHRQSGASSAAGSAR